MLASFSRILIITAGGASSYCDTELALHYHYIYNYCCSRCKVYTYNYLLLNVILSV